MRASVECAFEFAHGRERRGRNVQTIEEDRFVLREEMKIVFQCDQIVLADFRIGGIRILHIDRIVLQRCVTETVVDSGNVTRRN